MLKGLVRRSLAVGLSLILMHLTSAAALANHQGNCSEYYFVTHAKGYISTSWVNHRYGVRAFLDGQVLDLCTNPRPGEGSASTAWVAIQGPPVAPGNPYGNIFQVGHGRCRPLAGQGCDGTMQDGYAWGRWSGSPGCAGFSDKAPTGVFLGAWSGGGTYSVVEEADGDFVWRTPTYSGFVINGVCWSNQYVAVFAETLDYGDALGGTANDSFNFQFKEFQTDPGGAWQTLPTLCNAATNAPNPPFKCSAEHPVLRTWTAR